MRRRFADIFAVICVVFLVFFVFMWGRSFFVADQLRHQDRSGFEGLLSSRGSIALFNYDTSEFNVKTSPGWSFTTGGPISIATEELARASRHRSFVGFWFFRDSKLPQSPSQPLPGWCLVLPYWFFTLLFALIPLGRLIRVGGRRPAKKA